MQKQLTAFIRTHKTSFYWILLAVLTIALRLTASATQIEHVYSRGIFPWIRAAIDLLTGSSPIALIYVLIPLAIWLFIRSIPKIYRRQQAWGARLVSFAIHLLGLVAALVSLFLWLWGFNYGRIPVEQQIGLQQENLPLDSLIDVLEQETTDLITLRARIPEASADSIPLPTSALPQDMESPLSTDLERVLAHYNYPTRGKVRLRLLYPKGIFLRFSSSGLYFPFTGEGHVDAGLIPLQRAAVMAHELAHGYGFGDEGVCSFWAYLVCYEAADPAVAYTGRLTYWRQLAAIYKRYRPDDYALFRRELPIGMQADLDAINQNLLAYPDILPAVRYAAYDAYLKAQGIQEGMLNYGRVVELVEAWRRQQTR